jgi:hypothetical protein
MTTDEIDTASDETLNKLAAELWPTGFKETMIAYAVSIDAQSPLLTELVGTGWEIRVETLFYDCETFWRCSLRNRDKPIEAIAETETLCRLRAILKAKLVQDELEKGEKE